MLTKILFLIVTLVIQEVVLLNSLFLATHNGLYSPVVIFILFVVATTLDICIGFLIGKQLRRKTANTKFARYIQKQSERFSLSKESKKRWFAFLVLGNISFCYINAAVAGYLDLPFWESQAYNFFGNILSYVLLWYAVGSISSLFGNQYTAAVAVIAITVVLLLILRKMHIKKV